jgi:hypothetical protein
MKAYIAVIKEQNIHLLMQLAVTRRQLQKHTERQLQQLACEIGRSDELSALKVLSQICVGGTTIDI